MCRLAEMPKMLFVSLTADSIAATFLQYEWYFETYALMNIFLLYSLLGLKVKVKVTGLTLLICK